MSLTRAVAEAVKADAVVTKPKPKNKGDIPERVVPAELALILNDRMRLLVNLEQMNDDLAKMDEEIITFSRKHQDQEGFAGRFSSSYLLVGGDYPIEVTFRNRYTIVDGPKLQALVGKQLAPIKRKLKLRDGINDNKTLQNLLVDLLGSRFSDFFSIEEEIVVCKDFNRLVYDAVTAAKLAKVRLVATQYKPTIQ